MTFPSPIKDSHDYTKSESPWLIDIGDIPERFNSEKGKFRWKLLRYLAGGGMKSLGRTIQQDEAEFRQNGFFVQCGIFFSIWLVLWLI